MERQSKIQSPNLNQRIFNLYVSKLNCVYASLICSHYNDPKLFATFNSSQRLPPNIEFLAIPICVMKAFTPCAHGAVLLRAQPPGKRYATTPIYLTVYRLLEPSRPLEYCILIELPSSELLRHIFIAVEIPHFLPESPLVAAGNGG